MRYLIKNGRVIDPANGIDDTLDILVASGKIEKVGKGLAEKADETIDAKGRIVAPGFIDLHVHLREPGREDEETVATGTRAAVRGGFTTVVCMPNTEPAIDSAKAVKELLGMIGRDALVRVAVAGAATIGRAGAKVADIIGMREEGIIAISDDGSSVENEQLLLEALKLAKKAGVFMSGHCEDAAIAGKGVMNKGFVSTKAGLRGIPAEAEYTRVKRDIELAKKAGASIHIAHVSCKETVDIIRAAKKSGIEVTAEVTPHHITLTDDCCVTYDTNTKMNPPLRTAEDVAALIAGLADGTIDAIATDHAPHTDSEKDVEFDFAPFGIIGLETALSLAVSGLVENKALTWSALIRALSVNPARIAKLDGGSLRAGARADIVVIDPAREYVYTKESVESKSKNSPFIGWKLKAKVTHVFVAGKLMMKDETIV